jgi:hypothetical protein
MNRKPVVRHFGDKFNLGVVMLLIAVAGFGFWLILQDLRSKLSENGSFEDQFNAWLSALIFVLGGLSLVGPPLLLLTARGRPWGAGRLLWFAHGTAAWLLWPPIVSVRFRGGDVTSTSAACYFYGTPLMAVYVTLTLLAGGHFRRSRRRRITRSWQELFGLVLGLAWACTGLYLFSLIYRDDFRR